MDGVWYAEDPFGHAPWYVHCWQAVAETGYDLLPTSTTHVQIADIACSPLQSDSALEAAQDMEHWLGRAP